MTHSELRQDPTTRNWVIIAPQRDLRPTDLETHAPTGASGAATTTVCPFCRGQEEETPPEILRLNAPDGNWRLRVVPNRYPMLSEDGPPKRRVSAEGFI